MVEKHSDKSTIGSSTHRNHVIIHDPYSGVKLNKTVSMKLKKVSNSIRSIRKFPATVKKTSNSIVDSTKIIGMLNIVSNIKFLPEKIIVPHNAIRVAATVKMVA